MSFFKSPTMRVVVDVRVVFEVERAPVEEVRLDFQNGHETMIDHPMETVTGRRYVLRRLDRFEMREFHGDH